MTMSADRMNVGQKPPSRYSPEPAYEGSKTLENATIASNIRTELAHTAMRLMNSMNW